MGSTYCRKVPCCKDYVFVDTPCHYKSLFHIQVLKDFPHLFCFCCIHFQFIQNDKLVVLHPACQCGTDSCLFFLPVHLKGIIPWHRGKNNAAAFPLGRPYRTLPCMACSFLPPRFFPAAGNFRTGFCFLRSQTFICKLLYDCHVYQMFIDFNTEYRIV